MLAQSSVCALYVRCATRLPMPIRKFLSPQLSPWTIECCFAVAPRNDLARNSESTDVRFFSESDLPWNELAYSDIGVYLRAYFCERRTGSQVIHFGCLDEKRVARQIYHVSDVEVWHGLRTTASPTHHESAASNASPPPYRRQTNLGG